MVVRDYLRGAGALLCRRTASRERKKKKKKKKKSKKVQERRRRGTQIYNIDEKRRIQSANHMNILFVSMKQPGCVLGALVGSAFGGRR